MRVGVVVFGFVVSLKRVYGVAVVVMTLKSLFFGVVVVVLVTLKRVLPPLSSSLSLL